MQTSMLFEVSKTENQAQWCYNNVIITSLWRHNYVIITLGIIRDIAPTRKRLDITERISGFINRPSSNLLSRSLLFWLPRKSSSIYFESQRIRLFCRQMASSESKSEFSFLAIFFGISIPNVSKDKLQRAKIEKTAGSLFGYI